MTVTVVQEKECACGCGEQLNGRRSHWFYSPSCQSLWLGFSHLPEPVATWHRNRWRTCIEAIMGGPMHMHVENPMGWEEESMIWEARRWISDYFPHRPDVMALINPRGIKPDDITTLAGAHLVLLRIRSWRISQGGEWWSLREL